MTKSLHNNRLEPNLFSVRQVVVGRSVLGFPAYVLLVGGYHVHVSQHLASDWKEGLHTLPFSLSSWKLPVCMRSTLRMLQCSCCCIAKVGREAWQSNGDLPPNRILAQTAQTHSNKVCRSRVLAAGMQVATKYMVMTSMRSSYQTECQSTQHKGH